ncbi:hypothetical protein GMST_33650 [Geomonas silvestris]|uniref:Lactate permease n=1 Tax=Geomonas silvestris TaxID=2740184 RepID=A0A6V8MLZ2_9BACT|nr:hypothetical protein [Geomonas silvestris]GFO61040.1 hypothetical protein GMST_33650 [Geomonas silvestris]
MDEKLKSAMRESFRRISNPVSADGYRLAKEDIAGLSGLGLFAGETTYTPVTIGEAKRIVDELAGEYSKSKVDGYLNDAQSRVLEAIIRPFGLAKVLFEDKEGGNVTTVNNARQGCYAREEDRYHDNDYRTSRYRTAANEIKEARTVDDEIHYGEDPSDLYETNESSWLTDSYSGRETHPDSADVDHIFATKRYHEEGGFMQSREKRRDFGADKENLAPTHQAANRSLGDQDKHEWQEKQARDGSGRSQKEAHGHDNRRVNAAVRRGEKTAERHLPTSTEKAAYYSERIAKTGCAEGAKMGLQQAMGVFLLELARAMWSETRDALANGIATDASQSTAGALAQRLRRVGERVLSKWKEVAVAFKDGAISGFLSNLVTTLVNMFLKTAKNAVRIIREGFSSLLRGFKFIVAPPEGLSKAEAYHEAGKFIAGGVAVSLGILAEEAVDKAVATIPVIGQFAPYLTPVLVGVAVGLGTAFLCYLWDKLDLFGAEEQRRHEFIVESLQTEKECARQAADSAFSERGRLIGEGKDIAAHIEQLDEEIRLLLAAG